MRAVPLRIAGSGFCPILSQRERRDGARRAPPNSGRRPRAMFALDASVGKVKKMFSQPWVALRFEKQVIVFVFNVCYNNTRIRIQ